MRLANTLQQQPVSAQIVLQVSTHLPLEPALHQHAKIVRLANTLQQQPVFAQIVLQASTLQLEPSNAPIVLWASILLPSAQALQQHVKIVLPASTLQLEPSNAPTVLLESTRQRQGPVSALTVRRANTQPQVAKLLNLCV